MLKCLQVRVGQKVTHEGKEKTIIASCLAYVMLTDRPLEDFETTAEGAKKANYEYGPWIDLDEIQIEGGWK